jgi:hypothetical protein
MADYTEEQLKKLAYLRELKGTNDRMASFLEPVTGSPAAKTTVPGTNPGGFEGLLNTLRDQAGKASEATKQAAQRAAQTPLGQAVAQGPESAFRYATEVPGRPGVVRGAGQSLLGGGITGGALSGLDPLLKGNLPGAVVAAGAGATTGAVLNPIANVLTEGMIKNGPWPVKALGYAGRFLAPGILAAAAGGAAQRAIAPNAGEESSFPDPAAASLPLSVAGIPLNKAAAEEAKILRDADIQRGIRAKDMATDLAYRKEVINFNNLAARRQAEAMYPLLKQAANDALVRQQAMMNLQTNSYARLGTLSMAGNLAQGAQGETGALMRTIASTNPYAGSTIQAPAIRFG